ncbi:MAG: photosystem II reaction center X protein [Pseudanabaena sp. CAN_BIN31]|jgi:hypothetical protein|nr:photosystem II reaction center X protein [Pseudanabaena sp. CAN_BIN31]
MTQSLSNFLFSLLAGGVVLGLIFAAVLIVSNKDRTVRRG